MRQLVAEALHALGVDRLVCAVHDRCLPSRPEDDTGCGSPGSRGAEDFLDFLAGLGFNGVQLGPPGQISPGNLSPYDGSVFSRSVLNMAWRPIADGMHGPKLLQEESLSLIREPNIPGDRCDYPAAFDNHARLLAVLHRNWDGLEASESAEARELAGRLNEFRRQSAEWLHRDALFHVLSRHHGRAETSEWNDQRAANLFSRACRGELRAARLGELERRLAEPLERYTREQWLLAEQHAAFHREASRAGLLLYGDLQVGLSLGDRWARAELLLQGYSMGAPPSRTNPEGQPWNYPVLDPGLLGTCESPGPALNFHIQRLAKLFGEYDGVRLDHPHGLVCPWVYRNDDPDCYAAVRAGARLYSVGPSEKHVQLASHDIARPGDLAIGRQDPWADGWVAMLDDGQVARYSVVFDTLLQVAANHGVRREHVLCEVLSTQPYPLQRVIDRHGLGRFRVTSKADVNRMDDVYLPANAQPEDWIMVGTHDTPPIWWMVRQWRTSQIAARVRHAAAVLAPDGVGRDALASYFSRAPESLALAEMAVLFTSRARNVMVFVCDLLGESAIYNRPGIVHAENWTWRIRSDYRSQHAERLAKGRALDLAAALALAVAALPRQERRSQDALIRALIGAARGPVPPLEERLGVASD